jgi:heterodisulfide reductase subunit A-like polyferredoxin
VVKFAYQLHLDSAFAVAAAAAVGSAAVVLYWRASIDLPTPPAIQAGASQKRVVIIGGGSVGLVCAKSVLEEGMGAVLFEKTSGGLTKTKTKSA